MSFLYEQENDVEIFDYKSRREVRRYICKELEESRFMSEKNSDLTWLSDEHRELVEYFIDSVIKLDSAVKKYIKFLVSQHEV